MQFVKADIQDLTGIRTIWEEQFTTESEYLSVMFGEIIPNCTSYVCKDGNKVISALSLMPMLFIDDNKGTRLNGWYMFGVTTLRDYWGKRIAAQTIEYASSEMEKEGFSFIFERPANQTLNNYYSKLGFTKQLQYIPHRFNTAIFDGSTRNIGIEDSAKAESENVLKEIRRCHPKRFEWSEPSIIQSLIKIGELEFNNTTYCKTPPEGVFISIKTMNKTPENIFNNAFFCFPME